VELVLPHELVPLLHQNKTKVATALHYQRINFAVPPVVQRTVLSLTGITGASATSLVVVVNKQENVISLLVLQMEVLLVHHSKIRNHVTRKHALLTVMLVIGANGLSVLNLAMVVRVLAQEMFGLLHRTMDGSVLHFVMNVTATHSIVLLIALSVIGANGLSVLNLVTVVKVLVQELFKLVQITMDNSVLLLVMTVIATLKTAQSTAMLVIGAPGLSVLSLAMAVRVLVQDRFELVRITTEMHVLLSTMTATVIQTRVLWIAPSQNGEVGPSARNLAKVERADDQEELLLLVPIMVGTVLLLMKTVTVTLSNAQAWIALYPPGALGVRALYHVAMVHKAYLEQ